MLPANVEDEPSLRNKTGVFRDREHAGKLIAEKLSKYRDQDRSTVVAAIPSGGVPVGYTIATQLRVPLDIILARKIPIPWEPEAGFGSVAFDGSTFLNEHLVRTLNLSRAEINKCIEIAEKGLQVRARKFLDIRKEGLLADISGKTVILVDDGLASGYTMLASAESIKKRKPNKIVVAVPTASLSGVNLVSPKVDELLCINLRTGSFFAVADAYEKWYDVPEKEALALVLALRQEGSDTSV